VKSRNWLDGHQRMYAFYGGVPHVTGKRPVWAPSFSD
jgi:hypothetical protein